MLQTDVDKLMAELGSSLEIEGLRFNHAASCQLVFDQSLVVTIIHDRASGCITLNCPVSHADQFERLNKQTLVAMLQANFMRQGCPNATLSFAEDKRAYLQSAIPLSDPSHCNLSGALELLLNQAEVWSERLRQSRELDALDPPSFSRTDRHLVEAIARTRQKV